MMSILYNLYNPDSVSLHPGYITNPERRGYLMTEALHTMKAKRAAA